MAEYEIVSFSDPGRMRSENEDAVAAISELGLAILADGMGGYQAGEVASRMAIEGISKELGTSLPHVLRQTGENLRQALWDDLRFAVSRANEDIYQLANKSEDHEGMGSTLVVAVLAQHRLFIAHLGDSRAYRLTGGRLEQLTRDHCWVDEQIAAGLLTEDQITDKRFHNIVTRALGVEDEVELEIHEHPFESDDIILLCSDGLTDMISDSEIQELLNAIGPLESRARRMIDLANEHGGKDNISVILLRQKPAAPPSLAGRLKDLFRLGKR